MSNSKKIQTDKVCSMCGDVGYARDIATCSLCKRISEHTYCMQILHRVVPKVWHCKECAATNQVSSTKRKTIQIGLMDVKKATTPVKRICSSNRRGFKQINGHEKQPTGTQNLLDTRGCSSSIPDIKNQRISTTGPSSGIRATQPLSNNHSSGMVNNAKTTLEQAAFLPSREKGKAYDTRPRSGAFSAPDNWGNIKPAPILQRTPTTSSVSLGPKASEALYQEKWGTASVGAQHSLSKPTTESASGDKEGNTQSYKPSGKRSSDTLCKKEQLEGFVGPGSYHSPSNDITSTASHSAVVARSLPNDEERKRPVEKEGHAALIKEEPVEVCSSGQSYHLPLNYIKQMESKCCNNATGLHVSEAGHEIGINKLAAGQGALSAHMPDMASKALCNETTANLLPTGVSGNTICSDAQLEKPTCQNTNLPSTLLVVSSDKHPNRPVPEANWNGDFEIFDTICHVCHGIEGIQAHIPGSVSLKVYENLKQLPEKIKFKLCRRLDVWPKTFRVDPPAVDDIGLYFFPCEQQRSKETYTHFVEMVDKRDLAMQSWHGDVELLIYTSAQLPQDSQGLAPGMFMWGVFRHLRRKRQSRPDPAKSPPPYCTTSNNAHHRQNVTSGSSSEGHMVEVGTPVARTNRPLPGPNIPPGFSQPISRNQAHGKRPAVNSAPVNNNQATDIPPGFSKPYYPPKRR